MRSLHKLIILSLGVAVLLAACNLPSRTINSSATLQAVYTSQASTVQALQTMANSPRVSTSTPLPTGVFPTLPAAATASTTPYPTVTALSPTITPLPPTNKPILPTRTQVSYCDWAAFVKDVSVPDGSFFQPGAQFTKTWRLKNIGTCTWTTSYGLVFLRGNNMAGVATTSMPREVKPGQTVDISIDLTAPMAGGSHKGYWLLRNKAGLVFGLGKTASEPFYVEIKVAPRMVKVLDFASNYCDATWRSGAGVVACPGDPKSDLGYARYVKDPQLEDGQVYNGPGLLMVPENVKNGYLQGFYPPINVRNGDRFRATVYCKYQAKGCYATVRLDYQIANGPVQNIWVYTEAYEGQYYTVDTDLSGLAGKSVRFILTVLAAGSPEHDRLVWAGPRIMRFENLSAVLPTLTPLPTNSVPGATPIGN